MLKTDPQLNLETPNFISLFKGPEKKFYNNFNKYNNAK